MPTKSEKCPECRHVTARHDATDAAGWTDVCATCGCRALANRPANAVKPEEREQGLGGPQKADNPAAREPSGSDSADSNEGTKTEPADHAVDIPALYDGVGALAAALRVPAKGTINLPAEIEAGNAVEIGGHLNETGDEPGLTVVRLNSGNNWDGVYKVAHNEHNRAGLANDDRFLDLMEGSGHTPAVLTKGAGWSRHEDLGTSDEHPHDGETFRHNMIHLLWELRRRGIRHGDLTSANIILDDDWPYAIDFAEAHLIGQKAPQKRPHSDTHLVLRTLKDWPDDTGIADTPRVARRWEAVINHAASPTDLTLPLLGRRFLDLGCYAGDFVALAACEGMEAYGIDAGGFRTGENSINIGRDRFAYMREQNTFRGSITLDQADIIELDTFTAPIVLLFSTWSYMVIDHGLKPATAKLAEIISDCGTLYFENQLAGDGPGPAIFQNDAAIAAYLLQECGAGKVEPLVTVPVVGRPASRTVFAVQS